VRRKEEGRRKKEEEGRESTANSAISNLAL
jgi:hypothetical protein